MLRKKLLQKSVATNFVISHAETYTDGDLINGQNERLVSN